MASITPDVRIAVYSSPLLLALSALARVDLQLGMMSVSYPFCSVLHWESVLLQKRRYSSRSPSLSPTICYNRIRWTSPIFDLAFVLTTRHCATHRSPAAFKCYEHDYIFQL